MQILREYLPYLFSQTRPLSHHSAPRELAYDVSARPERRRKLRFIVISYDTYEEGINTLISAFMK